MHLYAIPVNKVVYYHTVTEGGGVRVCWIMTTCHCGIIDILFLDLSYNQG